MPAVPTSDPPAIQGASRGRVSGLFRLQDAFEMPVVHRPLAETALSIALSIAGTLICQAQQAPTHYHLTRRISGPDGLWDYASVDQQSRRLFVGRQGGILALDLDDPHGM